MNRNADEEQIEAVRRKVESLGYIANISRGKERVVLSLVGEGIRSEITEILRSLDGVEDVVHIKKPVKLSSREFQPEDTVINIEGVTIGGNEIVIMAGPCAVERRDQVLFSAFTIKEAGARIIRGGAFKTLDHPNDFPGLGQRGLEILYEAKQETGLLIISEVRTPRDVDVVDKFADILQVGARYMQDYDLLASVAERGKPVLLRRNIMCTLEELLMSAEYILNRNNKQVMLCERGIRTFERHSHFILDLCAIPILKRKSHLPVIVDPSHGTGDARYVSAMSKAAIAAGADGLQIEVHPNPKLALSHGEQALELQQFKDLMEELREVARAVGRTI